MAKGIVIIGGGMAGARAVIGLRAAGWEGEVTLISEEMLMPYDRPPLSKTAITTDDEPAPVTLLDESMAASLKAAVILDARVLRIDRAAKTIQLSLNRIGYDKLLIATGAKPRQLSCPGSKHALTLRDFHDASDLRAKFQPGARAVIVGGGFIGLELASSAVKRGCHVTLVETQPRILMRGVPEAIAAVVHARHVSAGVDIITGMGIESLSGHAVKLTDGRSIPADVVIAGIGAAPETRLASDAGLAIDNGIACDTYLRTSDPGIYAAGDCCSFPHPLFGNKRMRLEAWRNAQDQATVAAENMAGGSKPYSAVPWFWSDQYDLSLQVTGVPGEGVETVRRQISEQAFIIFHRDRSGRLVGASGIGPGNSIARDVKLAEMLIAKSASPAATALSDPAIGLKSLLKG